ncbi:MAG TPA: hypothetical protein VFR58_00185, partial [Flavisolibacter sp.]|nr:hypothetical protein [Flavisolibacter sp.]
MGEKLIKDEWYASLVENMIRSDHQDNLRTHYITGDENYRVISTSPIPQLIFNPSTGKSETVLQY